MTTASISYAKNNLSALLQLVRVGERVLITDRGVPVAYLAPVPVTAEPGPESGQALESLVRRGLAVPPKRPATRELLELPLPCPAPGVSASALVVAERESGY